MKTEHVLLLALGALVIVAGLLALPAERRPCLRGHNYTAIQMMPNRNGGWVQMPTTYFECDEYGPAVAR